MLKIEHVLKRAIYIWGEQSQLIKTIEELSELSKAIAKYLVKDVENRHDNDKLKDHIIEEIADVEIMITQLKIILNIRNLDIVHLKEKKIIRLYEFLDNNKKRH